MKGRRDKASRRTVRRVLAANLLAAGVLAAAAVPASAATTATFSSRSGFPGSPGTTSSR